MKKGSKKKTSQFVVLIDPWCTFYESSDEADIVHQHNFLVGTIFEIIDIEKRSGQEIVHLKMNYGENFGEYEINTKYFKNSFRLLPEVGEVL